MQYSICIQLTLPRLCAGVRRARKGLALSQKNAVHASFSRPGFFFPLFAGYIDVFAAYFDVSFALVLARWKTLVWRNTPGTPGRGLKVPNTAVRSAINAQRLNNAPGRGYRIASQVQLSCFAGPCKHCHGKRVPTEAAPTQLVLYLRGGTSPVVAAALDTTF